MWSPYSYLALVLPKSGFQAGYLFNEEWSVEPEYQSGSFGYGLSSFNMAEISEKLYTVPFHWQFDNGITVGADWIDISIPVYVETKLLLI
jgi:hypothetical protein